MKQGYVPPFKDQANEGSVRMFPQHDLVNQETSASGPIVPALGGRRGGLIFTRALQGSEKQVQKGTYIHAAKETDGREENSQEKESNRLQKMRDLRAKGDVIWTLHGAK